MERLIYTDLANNNNKFWHGSVEGTNVIFEWGRVGDSPQRKVKQCGSESIALNELNKRKNAKLRDGYTVQQTLNEMAPSNIAYVAKVQIQHNNDKETEKLIDFLIARNIHAIEGATSIRLEQGQLTTPLGPVTSAGLDRAEVLLNKMANYGNDFANQVNEYMRIVPRTIGRKKTDPRDLFGTNEQLMQEQTMLDSLRAVVKDISQRAATDAPLLFQTKLQLIDKGQDLHDRINKFFVRSVNPNHQSARMRLARLWEMHIELADSSFEYKIGNIKELWHGTKDANLLSILKAGYVVPRRGGSVAITGRMYGDGIYFSDQSSKSLNYATGFWGNGGSQRAFMLLNDVAMGKEYLARGGFSGGCPKGFDSCFAKASYSGVRNNEMIVYKSTQVKPKYLCEFE